MPEETVEQAAQQKAAPKKPTETKNLQTNLKTLHLSFGQGGGKLAFVVASKFDAVADIIYFNTSARDLEGLEDAAVADKSIKIGEGDIEGAGKDREVSFNLLGTYYSGIIKKITEIANKKVYDIIFVYFSTSGGTGSGCGPSMTALLSSDEFFKGLTSYPEDKKPITFGVAITPEISDLEGTKSLKNTLLALENINAHVNNMELGHPLARYILVTNGAAPIRDKKVQSSQHTMINKLVADYLYRYLNQYGHTRLINLDRADRVKSLETMGLHAFGSLAVNKTANGTFYSTGTTPFIIPEGERVRLVTYEVSEKQEEEVIQYFKDSGLSIDDTIHGFYDPEWAENASFIPIIGFHGFRNVSKISEKFSDRLNKILKDDAKREHENISSARGLDNVDTTAKVVNEEYGQKSSFSFADILKNNGEKK